MADLQAIKEQLDSLTLLEAAQLVKMLEEAWGVSAAAPVAVAAAGAPAAAAAAEPVEEQTEFDVVLQDAGAKKINVIKVVRTLTNLGLKEAKDVVEGAPSTLLTGVSKEAAQDAKAKLEAEGAVVQIK
ncbi:MAG TPA: 50S ribosomal protein L7/L12 [Caldilineaceae bacterium]|nr:50S ribosomal protein L7/L12 [Caldilineaceae bacterium]